ncbi:SAVED domain-containing protein [Deltaproteobacteria bacterium TL4]
MKLLLLSIGRDIAQSAESLLGRKADAVVRAGELTPEMYPELRRQIYQYFKQWQGEPLHLVLSGPVDLAFTLGQIIGINHFDVQVFHYDSAGRTYQPVPPPTRHEIL